MADTIDILFKTGRFNLSEVKTHFINEGCFGEDLAAWLSEKLIAEGFDVEEPYQEDWGWQMSAEKELCRYLLSVGGNSDHDESRPNFGEWRVVVEQHRTLKDRLFGKKVENPLPALLLRILSEEPGLADVRREV